MPNIRMRRKSPKTLPTASSSRLAVLFLAPRRGGRAGAGYTLADGLDETTAYGFMIDRQRALTGENRPATAAPSSPGGFCANCGRVRSSGARFCGNCGAQHVS